MLTLYGDLDSGNVYKVRLLLAQLGVPYRRVDTTQNRDETRTPEFQAINPIGKIPTVVFDDGRMLAGGASTTGPAHRRQPYARRARARGHGAAVGRQ
jgi:hypothetical protein